MAFINLKYDLIFIKIDKMQRKAFRQPQKLKTDYSGAYTKYPSNYISLLSHFESCCLGLYIKHLLWDIKALDMPISCQQKQIFTSPIPHALDGCGRRLRYVSHYDVISLDLASRIVLKLSDNLVFISSHPERRGIDFDT